MKLTNQQIEIIDRTLVLNGMVYDDVKLELIDHIATDIENQLEHQESDFEAALKKSFENWSDQLHLAKSFWVNTKKAVPRMLLDKWILESKKKLIKGSIIAIGLSVLITNIESIADNEIVIINTKRILQVIFSLELVAILVLKFIIWKSDKKTFSGFLLQTQTRFSVLFMMLLFCLRGMPLLSLNSDFKINLATNFIGMFYMILPIFFIQIALKHFQFIQKFKIS